ncbi:MAG: sigma-70 family RNA polymerase sigma factor [Flammeovirgaceae bacterium]|nr:sigma-70 family RNA polymerase sigma factor [Flammeovirgaceae bacterium]
MPNPDTNIQSLTDHLFRNESKKMVAVLTKIFGTENLETAEDIVQDTLLHAMNVWKIKGLPDNPSAWIFRVAKNKAIDIVRRNKHSVQYDFSTGERALLTSEYTVSAAMENLWKEEFIEDDLLAMMFACCHPAISSENQITLILKTLCGFSTIEIAKAFLTTEDIISKRLYRTKEFFRAHKVPLAIPSQEEIKKRVDTVLHAIYLLFNEGYNSTNTDDLIRKDVIEEAMALCKVLSENKHTQIPDVFALLALMCFHASRLDSRQSINGEIILLPEQDRGTWDQELIRQGDEYMDKAAFGDSMSSYHLEAAIAFEHCTASTFENTNWNRILYYYDWLCKISPSPITSLNRIVAVWHLHGARVALTELSSIKEKKKLESYYLYHSLAGELYSKMNDSGQALASFNVAMQLTNSEPEKRILHSKIAALLN